MKKTALAIGLALLTPSACFAFEPKFQGEGQLMANRFEPQGVLSMPVGRFLDGVLPMRSLSGRVSQRSWRVSSGFRGAAALAASLEAQLRSQGYDVVFSCETNGCGGFDFRFGIDVLPPPKMFVDLSSYFFISATRDSDLGPEAAWVLVSETLQAGMVQIETVLPPLEVAVPPATSAAEGEEEGGSAAEAGAFDGSPVGAVSELSAQLERAGHVVLGDLSFETGASTLASRDFASLAALARYLKANSSLRIALVGHTDSQGALDVNTRISQRRAQAVKERLVKQYGVAEGQLEARGAGYLSPVSSNRTEVGRDANRRVEAVLLNITE